MNLWIEVLLDDGEEFGCAEVHCTVEDAINDAIYTCKEHGLKPVAVVSVTDNDTGEEMWTY